MARFVRSELELDERLEHVGMESRGENFARWCSAGRWTRRRCTFRCATRSSRSFRCRCPRLVDQSHRLVEAACGDEALDERARVHHRPIRSNQRISSARSATLQSSVRCCLGWLVSQRRLRQRGCRRQATELLPERLGTRGQLQWHATQPPPLHPAPSAQRRTLAARGQTAEHGWRELY